MLDKITFARDYVKIIDAFFSVIDVYKTSKSFKRLTKNDQKVIGDITSIIVRLYDHSEKYTQDDVYQPNYLNNLVVFIQQETTSIRKLLNKL